MNYSTVVDQSDYNISTILYYNNTHYYKPISKVYCIPCSKMSLYWNYRLDSGSCEQSNSEQRSEKQTSVGPVSLTVRKEEFWKMIIQNVCAVLCSINVLEHLSSLIIIVTGYCKGRKDVHVSN